MGRGLAASRRVVRLEEVFADLIDNALTWIRFLHHTQPRHISRCSVYYPSKCPVYYPLSTPSSEDEHLGYGDVSRVVQSILTIGKVIIYQMTGEFVLRKDRLAESYATTVCDQWQHLMNCAHELLFGDPGNRERELLCSTDMRTDRRFRESSSEDAYWTGPR